jgi:hypothetical protein
MTEEDGVDGFIRKQSERAVDGRAAAPTVTVRHPDSQTLCFDDGSLAETTAQFLAVVVARNRDHRRDLLEQLQSKRLDQIAAMHDRINARSAKPANERRRQTPSEPGEMGVGHDAENHHAHD